MSSTKIKKTQKVKNRSQTGKKHTCNFTGKITEKYDYRLGNLKKREMLQFHKAS